MTRIVSMPLYIAMLLSLTLHATLIVAPTWLTAKQRPLPLPRIEARLLPLPFPSATAESVSTKAASTDRANEPERLSAQPKALRGKSLSRAQAALSEHLFYPPEAVARGMEGEVILLLTLSESGQLLSASVARSSGHALLDQAALDAARRLGSLPGNSRQTLFPVSFSLQ